MKIVFISYASTDIFPVDCAQFLEENGLKCWIAPRDIPAGESYAKTIISAIRSCDIFVVFISCASMSSENVLNEIEMAHSLNKIIVPVLLDKVELSDEFKYYLSRKQWVDIVNAERKCEEIFKTIEISKNNIQRESATKCNVVNWAKKVLIGIMCFLLVYMLLFTVGYYLNRHYSYDEYVFQHDLINNVEVVDNSIVYKNNGITAIYNAEQKCLTSIQKENTNFEISSTDLWRAASLSSGFAVWAKNIKLLKLKGKATLWIVAGTFVGTLFGYSTGAYVAEISNSAEYSTEMEKYLNDTTSWAICQQKFEKRKQQLMKYEN